MNNRKPPNRNIVSFYLNNSEYASLKLVAALEQKSIHGYVKDLVYTRINKVDLAKGPKTDLKNGKQLDQDVATNLELGLMVAQQLGCLAEYLTAMIDIQAKASKMLEADELEQVKAEMGIGAKNVKD